jgi:hypothetical protein
MSKIPLWEVAVGEQRVWCGSPWLLTPTSSLRFLLSMKCPLQKYPQRALFRFKVKEFAPEIQHFGGRFLMSEVRHT